MTFANATPGATTDGITYSSAAALPAAEGDLWNGVRFDPIPVPYEAAIVASVELSVVGNPANNSAYVILQTDLGDGVWYDLAWCVWTGTTGSANFLLSAGVGGANSFQQSRAVGTAPAGNGSNQCPLGARVRFVGKATLTAGSSTPGTFDSSSSSSGAGTPAAVPTVTATIKYKLTPLR